MLGIFSYGFQHEKSNESIHFAVSPYGSEIRVSLWVGGRVVSAADLYARGPGFEPRRRLAKGLSVCSVLCSPTVHSAECT